MTKKTHDILFIISLLIVPLLNFAIFWVGVNFSSIRMGFFDESGSFSTINFKLFFEELRLPESIPGGIVRALKNTLAYFLVGNFISLPLTYIISYFIYKKIRFYKIYRVVYFLPSIISAVILTSLYSELISPTGAIPKLLNDLGIENVPNFLGNSEYATKAIILFCIWTGPGTNLILFNGAMARIPEEVLESASIDGVGIVKELWYFIIPLTISTLITVWTLSIAGIFMASGPILLLTNGKYETQTLDFWIYERVADSKKADPNYAACVGLIFTCIGTPITLISRYFLNKLDSGAQY